MRTRWVETYTPDPHSLVRNRAQVQSQTVRDPWAGTRVYVRVDAVAKGRFGYVVSSDPLRKTARVQLDGTMDRAQVVVDFRNLIAA